MAAPPPDSSYTPPDTPLNETPFDNDSMEDLDPQATRKRPRLDSGSGVSPTLSLDGTSRTASVAPASDMDEASDAGRPASKVTLNMKSPLTSNSTAQPTISDSDRELQTDADITPNVICLSSSPSTPQSPEIEVAEPEDIDQESTTSNWRSLDQVLHEQDEPEIIEIEDTVHLAETFPKLDDDMGHRDNFKAIGDMIEHGHQREGVALAAVQRWFNECARTLDRLTLEEFTSDLEFWENLPIIVERLLHRQHDLNLDVVENFWVFFETFFLDYCRLVLHLVRLDTSVLSRFTGDSDIDPPLSTSRRYLQTFGWVFNSPDTSFYLALHSRYPNQTLNLIARIKCRVQSPPFDAAGALMQYASHVLAVVPKCPQVFSALPCVMVNAVIFYEYDLEKYQIGPSRWVDDMASLQSLYETARAFDKAYQTFVTKKSQLVTSEMSNHILSCLMRSYSFLCTVDPDFIPQLAKDLEMTLPEDTDSEQIKLCVLWTWKFDALKKQVMEGRMELRVIGVETMQSHLVNLWTTQFSLGNNAQFAQHLVDFLRKNKILEYLMSVDSHPQLIARSSNIFGFLIVTGNYDNYITDIIWKAVLDSQDDRTVSEITAMLARTFPMHGTRANALLYLCSKLLEFPLERYDSRIIDLCEQLVPRMQEKSYDRDYRAMTNEDHVDSIPLKLCVRLIRESAGDEDLPAEKKEILQEFGSRQLVMFIKAGLNETDKTETYERCIQDIADMNACTAGSIQVLNALVSQNDARELWKLATDFDLTTLVITELHNFVEKGCTNPNDSQHGFASRVELLRRLIEFAPDTITAELGNIVWKQILMSEKLPHEERQIIWKMAEATLRNAKENPFMERCIHEYLPGVPPKYYSREVLCFAQQSVFYDISIKAPPVVGEDEIISVPGMDRIWNFILTAPPQTIETDAIKFAIDLYLDHGIITRSPRSAVDATHVALVDRCVDQLNSAAAALKPVSTEPSNGDESMKVDNQNGEIGTEELVFSRSLLFLRQLLYGLRTRPRYNSPQSAGNSPPSFAERPLKGEPVNIRYQCFAGSSEAKMVSMTIGELSTAAELVDVLTQKTRFSKFSIIYCGNRLELLQNPTALVKDLKLDQGLLLIRKSPDAHEITLTGPSRSMTAVDKEVLKHFDKLYDLLVLKDELARQIIDFLVVFPPQGQGLELVKSNDKSATDLFPLKTPFKALYSLNTLSMCLHEAALAVDIIAQQDFVSHSIQVLAAFLTSDELFGLLSSSSIIMMLASRAVECLLLSISVHRSTDGNSTLIPDPTALVPRIMSLLETGRKNLLDPQTSACAQSLVCNSFAVLVEASLRDQNVWNSVQQHADFDELISSLLLEESRTPVRKEIMERFKIMSGPLKPLNMRMSLTNEDSPIAENPLRIEMLATVWRSIVRVIPKALEYVNQSEEFLIVALCIFRSVAERSPRDVIFGDYLKQWSTILLDHKTEEFVGREKVDPLVIGISGLLEWCLELATNANVTLDSGDIAEQLLNKYLFPDFSPDTAGPANPIIPIMHSYTRQKLYNVVTILCQQNDLTYGRILELLDTIVPRDTSYLECSFDRSAMIRSSEGYAGLKNLSNTCYLNSLMTQLFMNIEFRDFILNLHVADPASQKLLYETQKLFIWMQETWRKSIEPQDFVESIRTYDNEQIDVTVQMDVDEFYNLLFDRWEAQVLDPEKKKSFRSFYGGQLVQQIKSMECTHISEREEPFSAIQCEIKGKATLEDSLRAYVAGEMMQGNNKYSCTSCGRHVDAVKRACLKDVPDNLIFHLKRFDFDMISMLRSKINDEFQFPLHIDMAPYTVEHLADPDQPIEPDMFELVGVLVHTGTAESGHYYSYTLERPSPSGDASWVEFNDSEVSRFDPASMSDHCFGGIQPPQYVNGNGKVKAWNAYMLFYQRVSTIEKSKSMYKPQKPDIPVHVPVPVSVQNHISMDNELLIRTYCLLDPQYAFFVHKLLQRWSEMPSGEVKIRAEPLAINVGMDTIEQLVTRTKELQGHQEIYHDLVNMIDGSSSAAQSALRWVCDRRTSMRNLMTKTPSQEVRGKLILLINHALKHMYVLSTDPNIEGDEQSSWRVEFDSALQNIVSMLAELWPEVQSIPRVWEDYFGFFSKLCQYGPSAVQILLEQGLLVNCLQILWIDSEDRKGLQIQYAHYVRLMEKGRRFPYLSLLALCLLLIKHIDLSAGPSPVDEDRMFLTATGKFSPREIELDLIQPLDEDGSLSILMKIFRHWSIAKTQPARMILAVLLDGEPEAGLLTAIHKTLENGLRMDPAIHCTPFLEAAVTFCQHCPDAKLVKDIIIFIANGVETIDSSGGQEHMDFFVRICGIINERLNMDSRAFTKLSLNLLPVYAPTLLIDRDESVRQNMKTLLNDVFIGDRDDTTDLTDAQQDDKEEGLGQDATTLYGIMQEERSQIGRRLQKACVERLTVAYLKDQNRPVDSKQLECIISVINYCIPTFYGDSEEDEDEVKKTRDLLNILETMSLQEIHNDVPSDSDVASVEEWEANSAIASDSEVGVRGSP